MAKNYQKELDNLLEKLPSQKPKLLLHACCGPCSSYVLEYLCKYFEITVFFYNPNIYPQKEHDRRLEELVNLYKKFPPVINNNIHLLCQEYTSLDFYNAIDLENHPEFSSEAEKGERCRLCYLLRLEKTYKYAKENNFDYFCTSLSISPFKDAEKINQIGIELEEKESFPKWLISDFKKKGGFKRSLELSKEYNLYRQDYCGCIFSLKNKNKNHSQ